ncbi:MAG: leucyl/phenylalanyl-tRNA--protein transferase [Lentisphaeria bacterium]|nr:leucyl/phenylalanyl-tRNA--protein transferase [Lentisphaeria bacterium]
MSSLPDHRIPHYFPMTGKKNLWYSDEITLPMLKEAYWHGIFPWPDSDESLKIPWVMPAARGMVLLPDFHIPRTVVRLMKKDLYELRIDTAFGEVIRNCADRNDGEDTWITSKIIRAYREFHEAGWAHSFEVWNRETGKLAGGLYGVSLGGIFAGESMFYRESGASKLALAALGLTLRQCGAAVLDTQMVTSVTALFGAEYYDLASYRFVLEKYRSEPLSAGQLRTALSAAFPPDRKGS